MNIVYRIAGLGLALLASLTAWPQCVPENCLDSLPVYGGICNRSVSDGRVGLDYYDVASFHITSACLDAGLLDSAFAGIGAKMLKIHSFRFSGLPAGLSGTMGQEEYGAPANGCGSISGVPSEAGLFEVYLQFMANVRTWPLSSACSGFFTLDLNNRPFGGAFLMKVLPDASFTGPDSLCCVLDAPVVLTPAGNGGGTFSGPGVEGNLFDPSLAGEGIHEIRYEVTAQGGEAIAPAAAFTMQRVTVNGARTCYRDDDGDGYGLTAEPLQACGCPPGYAANGGDCHDNDPGIHPAAADIPGNGIDEDCSGADSIVTSLHHLRESRFRLFPNPAFHEVVLVKEGGSGNARAALYSLQGLLLLETELHDGQTTLDVSRLAPGFYWVVMKDSLRPEVARFIKK